MNKSITVQTIVRAPLEKTWRYFTEPEHITKWAFASLDWQAPRAENDVRSGGKFMTRMEAKDGSTGFDFNGTYDEVVPHQKLAYKIEGGRKVVVTFWEEGNMTRVTETFEPENENPIEMQRGGWQAILDNFKKHVEAN